MFVKPAAGVEARLVKRACDRFSFANEGFEVVDLASCQVLPWTDSHYTLERTLQVKRADTRLRCKLGKFECFGFIRIE